MQILGLSGYARSGKDEAAKILVENHFWTRVAFADKLREVLAALNPIIAPTKEKYFTRSKNVVYLDEVIGAYGWDNYKSTEYGQEIRRLLQRLGTEAGREVMGENVWVNAALDTVPDSNIVVTDVRFPNEAQAIKDRGGYIVRITRKDTPPANDHPSETSLDDWDFDYRLSNDGSLQEYHDEVEKFLDAFGTDMYFKHVIGD